MNKEIKQNLLISSSAKKTIKESVNLASELNCGIEISRLPFYKSRETTKEEVILKLKDDLCGFTNRITLHAMFSDVNVAGQDPILREISQKRCIESFEVGKAIKADTILFHTGNKGTRHYGSQEQFKERFIIFWKEFIKRFEDTNIIAVIENVFEETPQYCINLFEGINSPNLKLALDCGQVNLYAQNTIVTDWIKEYGRNLYHLHIHNNFRSNDDHSNLENGTLDYVKIFAAVKEYCDNPSFVLEMFTEEDIRKSCDYFNKVMKN